MLEVSNFIFRYVRLCALDIPTEKKAKSFTHSGDPDQTPRFAASDLGLHFVPITPFFRGGAGGGRVGDSRQNQNWLTVVSFKKRDNRFLSRVVLLGGVAIRLRLAAWVSNSVAFLLVSRSSSRLNIY